MKLHKTNDIKMWHIPFDKVTTNNGTQIDFTGINNVELDMAVRYIYINARLLTYDLHVKPIVESMNLPNFTTINCTRPICFFNESCSTLQSMNSKVNMSIFMKDDQGDSIEYKLPIWRYLINPVEVNYNEPYYNNTCFLGIFRSNNNF